MSLIDTLQVGQTFRTTLCIVCLFLVAVWCDSVCAQSPVRIAAEDSTDPKSAERPQSKTLAELLEASSADNKVAQTAVEPSIGHSMLSADSETRLASALQPPLLSPEPYPSSDYQLAPGAVSETGRITASSEASLRRTQALANDYNRRAKNFDEPGLGARPYADYAPSAYISTQYQEAPGLPLYEKLLSPAEVTAEELDELVVRGPVAGSFLVPGSRTAFRLSGFVRLGANYDFDAIGTPDLFVPRSIGIPQQPGQNMNFSARPSRISLDTWTPSSLNDWMLHTFIQFDFLSGNPPGVGSSSNPRLRFAFIDWGYFRIGQDTTVFMDPSSFPRTADFQGPNGIVNSRQGVLRVTLPLTDRIRWATAAEQPFSDITVGNQGVNVQDVPDFTSHVRYDNDRFHFQVSTILRTLSFRPTVGSVQRETGGGVTLSGNFHPWAILSGNNPVREEAPSPLTRSRVLLQCSHGTGLGRYLQDTSGIGMDAALNMAGELETLEITGCVAGYEQWLSRRWMANCTYSNLQVGSTDALPGNTFAESDYLAVGLWWIPVANASIGAEYLWGQRENLDGQDASAERIQTVFVYNF